MGSKDFRHKETKKPKKGVSKVKTVSTIIEPEAIVEVIKKARKAPEVVEE